MAESDLKADSEFTESMDTTAFSSFLSDNGIPFEVCNVFEGKSYV